MDGVGIDQKNPQIEDNKKQPLFGGFFSKFQKWIIIVAIVLFALVAGVLLFSKLSNKSAETKGEIVWWGLWEDESAISEIISSYQKENPKVSIKYIRQSKEDYRERLSNALAKGSGPDIFRYHNSWLPMFKNELDKVPSSVYTPSSFASEFYPIAVSDLTYNSNLYGIPLEYDGLILYINEEIFEESGKNVPETWNELRQTAKELTVVNETGQITQSGVALGRVENVDHWPEILALMMLQNGVDLNNPTGKLAEDALQFFTVFSKVDGIWNNTLPSSTLAFSSGKLAMYFGPSWRAFEIRLQNPDLRFKTVPVPQLPKTEKNEPDVSYASYWVEGVWARSKNKDLAWDFLRYLSQVNNLQKFYDKASKTRMFGEPYPRPGMSNSLLDHPVVGAVVKSAPYAQSWFLQSRTWDGPTGINTQINKYFEDAVTAINDDNQTPDKVLPTVSSGVSQVLSAYGIKSR